MKNKENVVDPLNSLMVFISENDKDIVRVVNECQIEIESKVYQKALRLFLFWGPLEIMNEEREVVKAQVKGDESISPKIKYFANHVIENAESNVAKSKSWDMLVSKINSGNAKAILRYLKAPNELIKYGPLGIANRLWEINHSKSGEVVLVSTKDAAQWLWKKAKIAADGQSAMLKKIWMGLANQYHWQYDDQFIEQMRDREKNRLIEELVSNGVLDATFFEYLIGKDVKPYIRLALRYGNYEEKPVDEYLKERFSIYFDTEIYGEMSYQKIKYARIEYEKRKLLGCKPEEMKNFVKESRKTKRKVL